MHDDGYRVKSTGMCCGGKCGEDDFYIVAEDEGEIILVEGPYEGNGVVTHTRIPIVANYAGVPVEHVTVTKLCDIGKTVSDFRTSEVSDDEPEFESLEFSMAREEGIPTLSVVCGLMEFGMSLPRFYTWLGRVMKAVFAIEEVLSRFGLKRIEGPDALVSEESEYSFTVWATWQFEGDEKTMRMVAAVLAGKGVKPG